MCILRGDDIKVPVITFTIPGISVPKARPRTTKRGNRAIMYTPDKTKNFENYVKLIAAQHAPKELLTSALEVELHFFFQRPKSLPKKVQYHTKKPDVDNLAKSVLDAFEGIIYANDAQVISLRVTKEYGVPACVARIEEWNNK